MEMEQVEQPMNEQQEMRLRSALLHWASCLGIFILLLVLSGYHSAFGSLAFFFYLGAGFYLSRTMLRRIVEGTLCITLFTMSHRRN